MKILTKHAVHKTLQPLRDLLKIFTDKIIIPYIENKQYEFQWVIVKESINKEDTDGKGLWVDKSGSL